MDIVLKGEGDGIDAVKEIKSILDIPIIYLTAYSDEQTRKRADTTEPFDYILKPYKENELHDCIERALQKHKFEKKLVETGEWADNKLNGTGEAVIVTNKEGYIRFINSNAQELTGFKREEAIFMNLSEVFKIRIGSSPINNIESGKDGPDLIKDNKPQLSGLNLVKNIINEGIVSSITEEVYLSNIEGKEIPIECYASPLKDDNGEFLGATLIFNDISQRYNAEKNLLENEEKFKSIYTQSPIGIGIYDADGQIIDANIAALKLFGVDEKSNLNEFNIFNDFNLNKKEKIMLKDGKTVINEIKFDFDSYKPYKSYKTTKSGIIYLEITFKPLIFPDINTNHSYLIQFQDITKKRNVKESLQISKDKYTDLLESIEYPFIALDSDLNCNYTNKESESLTGILSDKTMGISVWELLPDFKNPKDLEESFRKCMDTQTSDIQICEYGDNEKFFLELNINPLNDGVSILLKDVTANKSWEDEIKTREEKYHNIVDDITEPVCRYNPNGTLTYANSSYKRYFGKGVVGTSFVFSIPSEEQEKMIAYIRSFYEGSPVKILESPIKMSNGDLQWWRWVTKALFDSDGSIKELQAVGHDITEHRNLEVELKNTINHLDMDIKEKTEYFDSTKKSLEAKLNESKNNIELLKEQSHELEDKFNETSQKLSENQVALKSNIEEHKIKEESFERTIEKLGNEVDDSKTKFDETIEKLQNELNARMKIEEVLNQKSQLLEIKLDDVTHELSRTRIDMETEIYKYVKIEKSLMKIKDELQKQVDIKTSSLKKVNKDLSGEKAKRKEIETKYHETEEKLQNQLKENQIKYHETIENMELEITELKIKYDEASKLLEENKNTVQNVHKHAKRNMQRISSLTSLQSDYIREQMVESIRDSQNHIKSIALVHEKLYESQDLENINFSDYINSLVDDIYSSYGVDTNRIAKHIQVENIFLDIDTATSCGLIINELVSNSIKHAYPGGKEGMIKIDIQPDDNGIEMIITDDGIGLPKGVNFDNTDSLGLQLVKTLTAEIDGKIDLEKNYNGTKFKIKI
jgi:PAS domain S-box-containing protein